MHYAGIETGPDSRDGRLAKKPKTQGTDGTKNLMLLIVCTTDFCDVLFTLQLL